MKTVLFAIGLMLATTAVGAQQRTSPPEAPKPPEVVGTYVAEGSNPDASQYRACVEVTRVRGTFRIHWIMEGGDIWGVGVFSNGVLAASYFGGAPAIVVYKVNGGDKLVGEWTMGGAEGETYSETLTRVEKCEVAAPRPMPPTPQRPPQAQFREA